MTTKLKKMNAILFSTLMITSMLAGSFAFTETVGAKESIDSGINKNNIHDGDRQFALGNQDLKASIRAFPSEETDLTAGGVYPIMYRVNTGGGGFLTSDRIENPRLTISVDQGDASITEVVSPDTSYTQFRETSDSVTLRGSSFFRTDEEHTATAFIKIPENTETNSITLSAETTTDKTTVEYTVTSGGSASSWEALAQRAEQRATFMRGYQSSYRAAVTFDDWNETYRTAMRDAMATAAIEGTKSQVIGSVPYVGTAQEARDAYQVTTGQYGGGTAGEIGRITLKLRNGLFSRIEANSVERAGNSSKPISQSIELYEAEADAWRNQNPEAALEYVQKQRAVLFNAGDVPYGGSYDKSLYFESKDQRGAADPGSDLRRFFNTLNSYSISEREHIKTEILPLARDPKPQVRTEKDSSTINNQLYDLSQGDTTNISFVVSNARSGGQTSKEGYFSFSHSPGINVTNISGIDGEVDQPVVMTSNPGENITNVNNETIEANNTLVDIYESYRPGESNVYTVTVERTDAETNPWIAYRAAFERAISDGSQESFARYPTGGEYDTDQQGFSVINLTATDDPSVDAPPTPVLDISESAVQTGEQVTIDAGDSTDDGQIATYEIRIDTDADGTYELVQNDVSTSRAFTTAGPKTIELSVTDDSGQTATTTETVQVNPSIEVSADFSTNRSYVTPGDTIEFIATSTADSYQWDFDGDSQPERQGKRVAYTFEESGQRQVTLSVADDERGTASASGTITVEDLERRVEQPNVVVDVPANVTTGESLTLDASESTARKIGDDGEITEAAITNYTWDIGSDGSVDLRGDRVSTEFETSGERALVVQVETETGATATATRTIAVNERNTSDPSPPREEVDVDIDDLAGQGTQGDPYIITNVSELQAMEHNLSASYILGDNVNASGTSEWNNGSGFDPIGGNARNESTPSPFGGSLDGGDYTIVGLLIDQSTRTHVGVFGYLGDSAVVTNVSVKDVSIAGDSSVGGLAGYNAGMVKGSYVNGSVNGTESVGGLVGTNSGEVTDSYATGNVHGNSDIGGLVGSNSGDSYPSPTVTKSYAITNISSNGSAVGGLVGVNSGGEVSFSYVDVAFTSDSEVGDLVGVSIGPQSVVSNSYATSSISGDGYSSGLVARNLQQSAKSGLLQLTRSEMVGQAAVGNMTRLDFENTWKSTEEYPQLRLVSEGDSRNSNSTQVELDSSDLTGSGTEDDPYVLTNASQLQAIEDDLDATYRLGTDIDASGTLQWNNGSGFHPIGAYRSTLNNEKNVPPFTGKLNGGGHMISGLTINRSNMDDVGLFGGIEYGTVQNLELTSVDITGGTFVGGVAGSTRGFRGDSRIQNVAVDGHVAGDYSVGGVAGLNYGTITGSTSNTTVDANGNTGGLAGSNGGTVTNSASNTTVIGGEDTGGLAGANTGQIKHSSANGTVNGTKRVGGLMGSGGVAENVSTNVVVIGNDQVGGVAGILSRDTIQHASAAGKVNGSKQTGGLVGLNREGTISQSSAQVNVSGSYQIGGLIGVNKGGASEVASIGSVIGNNRVGGLIGTNGGFSYDPPGLVFNAFATGNATGERRVGGLVGYNAPTGEIAHTYATGRVVGSDISPVGGSIGRNRGTSEDSYWNTHSTGQPESDGDAQGLVTAEMTGASAEKNMPGLDFTRLWNTTQSYPVLTTLSVNTTEAFTPSLPDTESNSTFTVDIDELQTQQSVKRGNRAAIVVNVSNTGNAQGSQSLELDFGNVTPTETRTLTLNHSESTELTLTHAVANNAELGNTTATVRSANTSDSVGIEVTKTKKESSNIIVDSDPAAGDFSSIRHAVESAADDDTVEVRPGTYSEQVTIDTDLTVIAPDGAQVDYGGSFGSAVQLSDGAAPTVEGLTITAPNSSGIDTDGAGAGWVVRDITINNTDFAAIRVGADGTIEDSRIQDADVGVTRISSAAWTLKNTTIERSGTAIRALSSDSDWRLQNVTVSESDLGVNAINSESDWTIHNSTFESLAGDGVLAMGSTGEWEIHNSQIRDTSRGINAQDSTGDWDVAASQFTEVLTGIDAARSTGQWTVRKTTIESKSTAEGIEDTAPSDETAVYAAETTGTWNINQSTLVDNQVGVNATDSDAAGNATYNYWGASDGPSGDFLGGGTAAVGNISVEPFYTDTALTSLDTFEVGSDMLVNPDAPGAYDSIQTAVEASSDGDTVEVRPGTYTEPVTIQNNITLVAPDGATLDGPDSNTFGTVGIQIAPDSIAGPISPEIRGLTIEGYDSGILVGGSGDGNLVGDYSDAASGDWIVKNVTVRNSGAAGIDANEGVGDWQISGSQVVNSTYEGISADGATGEWVIEATTINHTGREGIRAINTASSWTVRDTTIKNVSDVGIDASFNSADWVVRNTTIANNEGIGFADIGGIAALDTSGDWLVTESRIENNGGVGVGLDPGDEASPVSGNWTVTETRLIENDGGGISARTATTTGNATYSYWGAPDGPSGDFNGSGAVASGNVVISPFYTDTELTTLNTESRADAITIEHNPGSATASTPTGDGRMYADQLDIFVNTDDPVAFGGQGDLRLRVVDPDTGNTVIYTPTSNARTVPLDEMYRLGIQNGGTGEPQEEILPFPESSSNLSFENINATVEGDTGIYTNETFNEYVIELVDTDGNVIDSTNNRLVGMGYEASFEQDGETGLVTRDPAVDPGWTVEFALVGDDLSIPPSEQVIDTVEVNHTEGDEHFEIPLGELDADPGEYSWTLTIVDESRAELDRERIVSISGDTQSDTGVTIRDGFGQTDPQPDVTLQSPRPASQTTPTAFNVTAEQQEPETVTLEVLDGEGTVVFEKSTDGEFENGTFATWDSTNEDGDVVADGEYDVVVTVEDQAGTEVTAEEMVPVDNTAPAIENLEIVKPAGGETNDQITVRGDISEKGTNVQFAQAAIIAESTSYIKTKDFENADVVQTALEDGTLEVTFDATAISDEVGDGDFSIGMAAVDEAGNNALVEGDLFTIDTSPPSIQPGVSGLAEDTAVLTVEAEEDVTITNLDIKAVSSESESTADRTPASYDTDITPDDPATIEFDGGALNNEDTSFTIDIEAEDAAGNADTYTLTSSISSYRIEADGTAEVDPSAVNSSFVLTTDAESSANTEREATVVQSTSAPAGTDLADNQIADEFIDVSDIGLTEAELEEADVKIPLSEIDIEGIDDDELTMLYSPDGESDYETIEPDIVEEDGQEYLVATVDGFSQLAPAGVDDEPPTIESSSVDPGTNIDLADDDDSATITFDYEDALSEIDTTATSVDVSSVDSERVSTQITKSTTEVDVTSLEDGESIGIDITVVDEAGNEVNENVSLFIDDSSAGNEEDTDGGDGSTSGGGGSISGDDDSISGDDGNTGGGDGSTGGGTNSDTSGTTSDDTDDTDDTVDTDNTDNSTTDESTDDSMDDSTGDDSSDGGTTDESSSDDGVPGGTTSDDETSEDSTPGFGAIMALVALIAAALVAARRSR